MNADLESKPCLYQEARLSWKGDRGDGSVKMTRAFQNCRRTSFVNPQLRQHAQPRFLDLQQIARHRVNLKQITVGRGQ